MTLSLLKRVSLFSSILLLGLVCFWGTSFTAEGQTASIVFDPIRLCEYINKLETDFTVAHGKYVTPNGEYNATYNGKNYKMTPQKDSKNLLKALQLIPERGTKNDVIDILTNGKEISLPLGGFMGTKFSGNSGGIKQTIDETISLLQSNDTGLRIVSLFNPKPGVYFVIDYQNGNYKLLLVRNTLPLYIDELTAKVGSSFEQFYQENFYLSNKVSMFGMVSLYFDAVKNIDNVHFTMNCEANAAKEKIKELSIYLNKNDNLDIDKSIKIWEKEATSFLAIFDGNPVKFYATDAFGGVQKTFSSFDETIDFVTSNRRKDGVIISIEAGGNIANLVINKNNVYYLLQQNVQKPAITLGYALPIDTPLSFEIESNSDITIDWGDGVKNNMGNKTMISGKLLGSKIKIYGDILSFDCSSTQAISLDISGATHLEEILCSGNKISNLLLNYNTKLKLIDCEHNQLSSLNTSKLENLEKLLCSENQLKSIDISNNKKLKRLMVINNGLTSLDVTNNRALNILNCSENAIEQLNLTQNEALVQLIAGNNLLSTIDVSGCTLLERLILKNNQLKTVDLEHNTHLQTIDISKNLLNEVKLSPMEHLTECLLQNNKLTAIDTEKIPTVMRLNVGCNQLSSLNVKTNVKLRDLYIYGNSMNHEATQTISQSIFDRSKESVPGHIYVRGTNLPQDNLLYKDSATNINKKNWEMYRVEEDADGNFREFILTVDDFEDTPSGVEPVTTKPGQLSWGNNILTCNTNMAGIEIFDFSGKLVGAFLKESAEYNLQGFSPAVYILVITHKNRAHQAIKVVVK